MTKYEKEKEMIERREQIRSNIKELQDKMNDARVLFSVIPTEDFREREIVKSEINKLSSYLDDEQRAYNATFSDDETAERIANILVSGAGV